MSEKMKTQETPQTFAPLSAEQRGAFEEEMAAHDAAVALCASTEAWRIVVASGLVFDVTVTHDGDGTYDAALDCSPFGKYFLSAEGSADAAIRRLVMAAEIDVREIVPPGAHTSAEVVEAAVLAAEQHRALIALAVAEERVRSADVCLAVADTYEDDGDAALTARECAHAVEHGMREYEP